jgi:hypothetical protein
MVEISTKTCARCETEFDIDEWYREVVVSDHPHPEEVKVGNVRDNQVYTVCGPCAADLKDWFQPDDVEAIRERHAEFSPEEFDLFE